MYSEYSLHVSGKGFLNLVLHVYDKASMSVICQCVKLEGMSAVQALVTLPLSYSVCYT